jgi:hypothetical protein
MKVDGVVAKILSEPFSVTAFFAKMLEVIGFEVAFPSIFYAKMSGLCKKRLGSDDHLINSRQIVKHLHRKYASAPPTTLAAAPVFDALVALRALF